MRARLAIIALSMELSASAAGSSWLIESASKDAKVTWSRDSVCDIVAPKGLTLWNRTLLQGDVVIDYEARIMSDARVSDLNCFWMADKALSGAKSRKGEFSRASEMSLYYVGYGGNSNTTTRFRRYDGQPQPAVIREYTDASHLIKADHWYRIHLESCQGRVLYVIDGDTLVNYVDLQPLRSGYFGFRTTESHAQLRRFRITHNAAEPPLRTLSLADMNCIGTRRAGMPFTFGLPFAEGELRKGERITVREADTDQWPLAYWPDGSIKWLGISGCLPSGDASAKPSPALVPEVSINGKCQPVLSVKVEREGRFSRCTRYDGKDFTMRIYSWTGCPEEKVVFTSFISEETAKEGLHEMSLRLKVPLQDKMHERHVWFAEDGGVRDMAVKPLIARRIISLDSLGNPATEKSRAILEEIASWDGFRLSQLSPNGYSIRKRATSSSPWIGTIEGRRAPGMVAVGDRHATVAVSLEDFWQSYPSTLQVDGARSDTAVVTVALWSPEAEAMNFAHYDTIPHGLEAAYEDVQPGMSTPVGTARTSTLWISSLPAGAPSQLSHAQYVPTPQYLHDRRAFGIWSLARGTDTDRQLDSLMLFFERQQEQHGWYGYFNYGDFMHTYDNSRGEWRYDVGGYAWDNTELGTPAMLWYQFLRTGDAAVWRLATGMTRHCSEVDTYHRGAHAGLGTRHNVLHWGCGAKEARISQAFWNRFMYYLTTDERLGDIMREVRDADTLLYTLDPLRLAQPRSEKYPCTAPARLRIGPDWLAYAGNWFTEWERTGDKHYRDKILTGMRSITAMPHGLFSGPLALGYDPATGILSWEGDSTVQHTNHLCTIMGGFEFMNEMMLSIHNKPWAAAWLDHAANYRYKAKTITHNSFPCPRLGLYAYWQTGNGEKLSVAKKEMQQHHPFSDTGWLFHTNNTSTDPKPAGYFFTNDAATWALDAIFLQEIE